MRGTGGDGSHTFNISTAAMFVAAAGGVNIAKHGNPQRLVVVGQRRRLWRPWACGSTATPAQVAESIEATGIGFMFAPAHHCAMKNVAAVRRELGVRTIFNILGPLTRIRLGPPTSSWACSTPTWSASWCGCCSAWARATC